MGGGHGDDLMWDGLACPPLEDYAFNLFDTSTSTLDDLMLHDSLLEDDLLDNPLLEIEEHEDMIANYFEEDRELDEMVAACMENPPTPPSHLLDDFPHLPAMFMVTHKSDRITRRKINIKAIVRTHPYGKGKVLKILAQVLPVEKHSKTTFDCQTKKRKDSSRLDHTNHVVTVDNKRKADYDDLRTEGLVLMNSVQDRHGEKVNDKPNYHPRHCGNHRKGKELNTEIQAMNLNEEEIKAFLGEREGVDNRDKTRKIMDCYGTQPMQRKDMTRLVNTNQLAVGYKRQTDNNFQPMQQKDKDHMNQCAVGKKRKADYNSKPMRQKNTTRLDQTNQTAVVENKRIADYESRFEASRQMLHKAYEQAREAKQQKHIQVIDFQKPETQQPGSKGKAKGKPSLRQKLMAMGTRNSNKKFPSYKMLSSCNQ